MSSSERDGVAEMPVIEVLLATFNGERFLREQIDSVLSQTYGSVSILARDDGSQDGTEGILREYETKFPNRFRVLRDGVATRHPMRNFERLLRASTAPYVALCDQDDVWTPAKLAMEMEAMQSAEQILGPNTPLLVFTDLEVVDENLTTIAPSLWKKQRIPGEQTGRFARLLAQNIFTGCTGLLNRALVERSLPIPAPAFMHDWWLVLVAGAFGRLVSLPQQTVRYRQHASNAVGAAKGSYGLLPKLRQHAERRKDWEMSEGNAHALLERYGDTLPQDKRRLVEEFIHAGNSPHRLERVWTLLRNGFLRESPRANLAMLWYLWDLEAAKRSAAAS